MLKTWGDLSINVIEYSNSFGVGLLLIGLPLASQCMDEHYLAEILLRNKGLDIIVHSILRHPFSQYSL